MLIKRLILKNGYDIFYKVNNKRRKTEGRILGTDMHLAGY